MGLVTNLNKAIPIPSYKQERLEKAKFVNGFLEEKLDEKIPKKKEKKQKVPHKAFVAEILEQKVKEAKKWDLRLPKSVVNNLNYFLDKYQFNYKAMVSDRRNYDQWTWKQFRMKIKKYMSIPEQFNEYLKSKNLPIDQTPDWEEYDSDSEWK